MNSIAILLFGIDLGGIENEWNFENGWEDYYSKYSTEDEDAGGEESELIYDLIAEFVTGEDTLENKYSVVRDSGLDLNSYGAHEYSGYIIGLDSFTETSYWEPVAIESFDGPDSIDINKLKNFVEFLDSKSLVLKEEFRNPKFLLVSYYG